MKRKLTLLGMSLMLLLSTLSPLSFAATNVAAENPVEPVASTFVDQDSARSNKCAKKMPFRDVNQDDWFHDSICTLYKKGAIDSAHYYQPDHVITRMEFMKEALITAGYTPKSIPGMTFKDMDENHWAWAVATTAHQLGFMNGYEGNMRPNDPITRGEALVVVMRMHHKELWGWKASDIYFRDVDPTDFYAYATILAWRNNIITGYANRVFYGEGAITRGESAEIITKSERVWPHTEFPGELL